jgi:hypothetical protein
MFYTKKKFDLSPKLKLGVGRGYNSSHFLKIFGALFLVVAVGLTARTLTLLLGHTNPAANNSGPQVLGASDEQNGNANLQFIDYKVQKGDTLFNLSQKYNISWTTLATLNNLESPFTLKLGQTLKIPKQ